MSSVPQQCGDCPQAPISKGFSLSSGLMPPKSGICILLENPDSNDCANRTKDLADGLIEIKRREALYPGLEEKWIRLGSPATSWDDIITTMWNWILSPMGLQRSDVGLYFTLNCFPGRDGSRKLLWPKGDFRKKAEATCAGLWLGPLLAWDPTVSVVGMAVASRSDSTPIPIALRAVEKAKMFAKQGERVLLLMGNRAARHWLGYGENSTRWAGHWQRETEGTRRRRSERWSENRRLSVVKVARVKKLTAKTALAELLTKAKFIHTPGISQDWSFDFWIPAERYEEMLSLTETKKKVKEEVAVG